MRLPAFLLLLLMPASGQLVSFGIKAGGAATGALDPQAQDVSEAKRYTLGPAVEIGLPFRLSAEIDVLYRRTGSRSAACDFGGCTFSSVRANMFLFPLLAKYRFLRGPTTPFAVGGMAAQWVRTASGNEQGWYEDPYIPGASPTVYRGRLFTPAEFNVGAVAGGGVEFRAGRARLSPELRYTRWNARYWEVYGSRGYFTGSNLNQIDILMGVTF
jgi:hypothetical protein